MNLPNDTKLLESAFMIIQNISQSGLSIYDPVEVGDPNLWIPSPELEALLNSQLTGLSLDSLPLRTRSKVIKKRICQILRYPIPTSFKKTKPRFLGQNFDTYTQKSRNLQIWNEDIPPSRRYVLIQISVENIVTKVKVVTGDMLSRLDTTGTVTQKYQATLSPSVEASELISNQDTDNIRLLVRDNLTIDPRLSPIEYPMAGQLLSIGSIYNKLQQLVGSSFSDAGSDQERNRGARLHRLVCERLGYSDYRDNGQFPDIRNQLLEIKLQTSPTIDLGLVKPDSVYYLDIPQLNGRKIRHCDVRYALFHARINDGRVEITNFFLTTGEMFFDRFPQFQGKVLNKKLQIPLPTNFFD